MGRALLGTGAAIPKSQVRNVMLPAVVSVKATARGAVPETGLALKAATGGGVTVTVSGAVTVPPVPIAVSV